jgi:2-C-methyl-D-erythritol 4-phosphate cytidylyltransferase
MSAANKEQPEDQPEDQSVEHILQPRGATPRVAVIIVAAGNSTRMQLKDGQRKPQLALGGKPILERTCALFHGLKEVSEIILVAHPEDIRTYEQWTIDCPELGKVRAIVPGGQERADSVRNGVFWCHFDVDIIAIHDAARPFCAPEVVREAFRIAHAKGAALVAAPVHDTIKVSEDEGRTATSTLDRSKLWAAQTPQVFSAKRLRELVERAVKEDFSPTDDAALWERYEGAIALVPSDASNIKITTPADLVIAKAILQGRS